MKGSGRKYEPRESLEKWLQTPEDWAPSFPEPRFLAPEQWKTKFPHGAPRNRGGYLWARFSQLVDGLWRVSIWGADDTGMEKDHKDRMEALDCYKRLPNPIMREQLKARGFVNA